MRSEAWRPAAAARNRSPREAGTPPSRHYDLGARSSLHGSGGNAGDGSAAPGAQNRHGGAPRGERPASWDARRLASAWRIASEARSRASLTHMIRLTGVPPSTRTSLGAPPTLDSGERSKVASPGRRSASRERDGLFDIVRYERKRDARYSALSPRGRGQLGVATRDDG